MITGIFLYSVAVIAILISIKSDKEKTIKAISIAKVSFFKLLPTALSILTFVGVVLAVLDESAVLSLIGEDSGIMGVIGSLIVGSVTMIPSFVAFQMGGSLLESGAGYPQVAAFIASLLGVGVLVMPIEIKYYGKQFTFIRNAMFFGVAAIFTVVVWGVF